MATAVVRDAREDSLNCLDMQVPGRGFAFRRALTSLVLNSPERIAFWRECDTLSFFSPGTYKEMRLETLARERLRLASPVLD